MLAVAVSVCALCAFEFNRMREILYSFISRHIFFRNFTSSNIFFSFQSENHYQYGFFSVRPSIRTIEPMHTNWKIKVSLSHSHSTKIILITITTTTTLLNRKSWKRVTLLLSVSQQSKMQKLFENQNVFHMVSSSDVVYSTMAEWYFIRSHEYTKLRKEINQSEKKAVPKRRTSERATWKKKIPCSMHNLNISE